MKRGRLRGSRGRKRGCKQGGEVSLPMTLVANAWCCWLFGSAAEQRADGAYGGQRKADEKAML